MARLLKEIPIQLEQTAPSFLHPNIDTNKIVEAGTSGEKQADMGFKFAEGIAKKMDTLERKNELIDVQDKANKAISDYELSWGEKDKYSKDNFNKYTDGLTKLYKSNKELIADASMATADDVTNWAATTNKQLTNKLFTEKGVQHTHKIKSITDKTMLNVEVLKGEYTQTGDENLKHQALDLFNHLEDMGINKDEISKLKIQTMLDFDNDANTKFIDEITNNPNLTSVEKINQLGKVMEQLGKEGTFETNTQEMIDNGLISKDYADIYKGLVKNNINNNFLSKDGKFGKAILKIKNKYDSDVDKAQNDVQDIYRNIQSGNSISAISKIEGEAVAAEDLTSPIKGLTEKYFGKNIEQIQKDNEYVPVYSNFQINTFKEEAKIDMQNGIPREETIQKVLSNIDMSTPTGITQSRNLIQKGVITQLEITANNLSGEEDIKKDIINGGSIGKANKKDNKLNGFYWVTENNNEVKDLNKLNFSQKQQLSEIVTGMGLTDNGSYKLLDSKGQISPSNFRYTYKNNEVFKNKINGIISILSKQKNIKYKQAKFNFDNASINKIVAQKYNLINEEEVK